MMVSVMMVDLVLNTINATSDQIVTTVSTSNITDCDGNDIPNDEMSWLGDGICANGFTA